MLGRGDSDKPTEKCGYKGENAVRKGYTPGFVWNIMWHDGVSGLAPAIISKLTWRFAKGQNMFGVKPYLKGVLGLAPAIQSSAFQC